MELEAKVNNGLFSLTHSNNVSEVYTVSLSWLDESTFVIRDNYIPYVYIQSQDNKISKVDGIRIAYNQFTFYLDSNIINESMVKKWVIMDVVIDLGNNKRIIANPNKTIEMYVRD